jgi:hypothetical protein
LQEHSREDSSRISCLEVRLEPGAYAPWPSRAAMCFCCAHRAPATGCGRTQEVATSALCERGSGAPRRRAPRGPCSPAYVEEPAFFRDAAKTALLKKAALLGGGGAPPPHKIKAVNSRRFPLFPNIGPMLERKKNTKKKLAADTSLKMCRIFSLTHRLP